MISYGKCDIMYCRDPEILSPVRGSLKPSEVQIIKERNFFLMFGLFCIRSPAERAKMKTELKTVSVPVEVLNPAPYNPRKWSKKATADLKESIKKFGMVDPIICNSAAERNNVVIGGHFRLHVAKSLGYKEVPVVYTLIPDIEKEKELNLRLNSNTGDWDFNLLKEFNLDMLLDVGFDSKLLKPIWGELNGVEEDNFQKETSTAKDINTNPGDIYQLGEHRLICGDSTDMKVINLLMNGEKANMLYSDMPYNISLDYDKGFGKDPKYGGKTDDSKTTEEYAKFVKTTILNGINSCEKDAHIFWYCDENYIWLVQTTYHSLGIDCKRVCLWIKNNQNPTPDVAFNKCYEPCIYGTIGSPKLNPINNLTEILSKEVTTGNDSVGEIKDMLDIWLEKRLPGADYGHPTEKPVTLHEKPLRRCSKQGDIVLDLFGGSGSSLIACEQLGRKCYTVEIEPVFCDLILERYEKYTGKKPVQIVCGNVTKARSN